jgi:hypothetical protein
VKRLELVRVRICAKCGRAAADLRTGDGDALTVALDPLRARHIRGEAPSDDVEPLVDHVLASLRRDGGNPQDVVLDLCDGRLRALLSSRRGEEHQVIACTAEEGLALAVRGGVKLYATEEALAGASARVGTPDHRSGGRGPDTVH